MSPAIRLPENGASEDRTRRGKGTAGLARTARGAQNDSTQLSSHDGTVSRSPRKGNWRAAHAAPGSDWNRRDRSAGFIPQDPESPQRVGTSRVHLNFQGSCGLKSAFRPRSERSLQAAAPELGSARNPLKRLLNQGFCTVNGALRPSDRHCQSHARQTASRGPHDLPPYFFAGFVSNSSSPCLHSTPTRLWSVISPAMSLRDSGVSSARWRKRFSGRAP